MKEIVCPKCGFHLTNHTYCVKCGYTKNVFSTDMKKYTNQNDVELYMKNSYKKVVYNKNLFLIFLLGPLYFSYFKFYGIGFLLFFLEFMGAYFIFYFFFTFGFGIEPLVIYYLGSRFFYVIIANFVLLKLIRKRVNSMKKEKNYQEKIASESSCSLRSLFISIVFVCFLLLLFLVWYRIQNGTLLK